jgi:hypothetical protein
VVMIEGRQLRIIPFLFCNEWVMINADWLEVMVWERGNWVVCHNEGCPCQVVYLD